LPNLVTLNRMKDEILSALEDYIQSHGSILVEGVAQLMGWSQARHMKEGRFGGITHPPLKFAFAKPARIRSRKFYYTGRLMNWAANLHADGLRIVPTTQEPIYSMVHENGRTIVPVRRRYLTVPINPRAYGHRATEFGPRLRPITIQWNGRIIKALVHYKTKKPYYWLRKRVNIPARPYLGISQEDVVAGNNIFQPYNQRFWEGFYPILKQIVERYRGEL